MHEQTGYLHQQTHINNQVNMHKQNLLHSEKEGNDQESIQSSTTPDSGYQWESENVTIRHHKRELIGQPFPSR